jgi:hypothetical protein
MSFEWKSKAAKFNKVISHAGYFMQLRQCKCILFGEEYLMLIA